MLPYPSGQLHMGHVRNYAIGDALARQMWMRGYNVLHPDGLGRLRAAGGKCRAQKQYAPARVDSGQHRGHETADAAPRLSATTGPPKSPPACPSTTAGISGSFCACMRRGLAYRKKSKVNWCPECATVLANEQVVDGCCWRHEDTLVEQRDLEQWFLRTTAYAQELLEGLEKLEGWPEKVRTMQRNWIGRSEGTEVDFFSRPTNRCRLDGCSGSFLAEDRCRADSRFTTRSTPFSAPPACNLRPSIRWSRFLPRPIRLEGAGGDAVTSRKRRAKRATSARSKNMASPPASLPESLQRPARAHLGGELRVDGIRHRRHHERSRPRRTRLRVCHKIRHRNSPGDQAGHSKTFLLQEFVQVATSGAENWPAWPSLGRRTKRAEYQSLDAAVGPIPGRCGPNPAMDKETRAG